MGSQPEMPSTTAIRFGLKVCFKGSPAERQELANDFMTAKRTRFTLDDKGRASNLEYVDENPHILAIGVRRYGG